MKIKNHNIKHIAFIMDGNGRWAKKRMLPRLAGHKMGIEALKKVVRACSELGIKTVSCYAFSTENWKRSKEEVDGIFNLLEVFLEDILQQVESYNYKITTMGNLEKLPQSLQAKIADVVLKTQNNTGVIVNVGLNYGGHDEILRAVNKCIQSKKECVDLQFFESCLDTYGLDNVDLIVRAGGEKRLSNFMLYQSAYSELYFSKTYWPDFDKKTLIKAIKIYQKRDRRFGNVKQEKKNEK